MSIDEIKKKIKFALDAVENIDESYKIEAFKIILSKELNHFSTTGKTNSSSSSKKTASSKQEKTSEKEQIQTLEPEIFDLNQLISKLDITEEELENVVSIENNLIDIHHTFEGTDKQNMINFAQCYLVIRFYVFKKEWVKTTEISGAMKKVVIEDKSGNLSKFLQDEKTTFVKRGKRKNSEIKLVAPKGREIALSTLKNLFNPVN